MAINPMTKMLKAEKFIQHENNEYKYGFYLGVLGATNDKKVRKYAQQRIKDLSEVV